MQVRKARRPVRGWTSGQQTAEFAVLIGIVAVAAIAMQYLAQRAIKAGLWNATVVALGDPGPENLANIRLVSLNASVNETRTQLGRADFHRTETSNQSVTGDSVTHDDFIRIIPDVD